MTSGEDLVALVVSGAP